LEELLARGHLDLAHLGFALTLGVVEHFGGVGFRLLANALPLLADMAQSEAKDENRDRGENDRRDQNDDFGHRLPLVRTGRGPGWIRKVLSKREVKGIPRVAVSAVRLEPDAPGGCPLHEPSASSYERGWHGPHG